MLKTNPAFVDVLVASVIERLQRGRSVRLPGIGTLSVEHEPASLSDSGSGDMISSPQERVEFKPEFR